MPGDIVFQDLFNQAREVRRHQFSESCSESELQAAAFFA